MPYSFFSRSQVVVLLLLALLSLPEPGRTQWLRADVNPRTYTSPSGAYTVTIDPDDRHGEHGATVTIRRRGQQVWSGKMPFTLLKAGITDDGTVGGYGFGVGNEGGFHVVLLDAQGKIRLDQVTPLQHSRFPDAGDDPRPGGLILDPENDRMVVRVADPDLNRGIESWWIYRLSTATALTKIKPRRQMEDSEATRFIIDAQHVAGTPLTLLHWWRFDRSLGARFTLIDLTGKPVWSMELPNDYQATKEDVRDQIMHEIRTHGAILRTDQAGSFDLRFVVAAQRVHFTVARAADGSWQVVEKSRAPYMPSSVRPAVPVLPTQRPSYLGSTTFPPEFTATASPLRNLEGFILAGSDRFAFIRREAKGPDTFVVVNTAGDLIHQVRLDRIPITAGSEWSGYIRTGGDRFLLTRSTRTIGGKAQAWFLDAASGAITALVDFDCPPIKRIAAFPGGGFMTLNTIDVKSTGWQEMYAFNAQGKQVWCQKGGQGYSDTDGPERLFSPEDLTVTPDGKVAVLDVIKHTVQIYDSGGRFLKLLNLDTAWGHRLHYPTNIVPDRNGGFLVFDYPARPSIVRTHPDGTVRVAIPLPANASLEHGLLDEIRIGSDGKVWVTDGNSLKRLTDDGKVDRVLGDRPVAEHLGHIDDLKMTDNGRIYALDVRAGAVHIFDEAGKHLGVRRSEPPPSSDTRGALAALTSSDFDGNELVSLYAPEGTPLRSFPVPTTLKEPYGLAFDGSRIVVGGRGKIVVFDTSGRALWEFAPSLPGEKNTSWQVFLVHGGRELRLYDGVRTIYRYQMP